MYLKKRLLRGGAPRAMDMLVCRADGDGDEGGGGGDDADKAVAAMAAKNAELLKEKKQLAEKLRLFEAEKADREKALADAEEEKARKSKDWDTLEKGYKDKLDAATADGYLWRSRYEGLVIDRGLDEALAGAKINPALAKAAHALIKAEHGVELSEDGKATIDGKPLADFVGSWAKTDTGKAFVVNGNSGGGANGGGGGGGGGDKPNPWKAGSINLTEQGRLLKSDRQAAIKLAAEAGVKIV